MKKIWLGLLCVFIAVQVYIFAFKKDPEEKKQNPVADNSLNAEPEILQKMQGGHLVESQQGKRDWELFSKESISYQGRSDWDLKEVEIRFYNSEMQDITVKGKVGNIDMQSKNMRIEGDVQIMTANGYTFVAPYIQYEAATRKIYCDQLIQVLGPVIQKIRSLKMTAVGISIPINERKIYLQNQVKGTQLLESGESVVVQSQSALLSVKSQTAEFSGQVLINHSERQMKSEFALFSYNEKSKAFESLELREKVELIEAERRATSDNLKIDFETQKLTFSGQPRLYQGEDELVGDKITFLDGGKRVKVENVKAKGMPIE